MARIAVAGAGAAGVGAAWQLRELVGDDADITVFEKKEHAGGRAWTVEFAGTTVEIGGSILHSTGKYTRQWQQLTGAKEGESGLSIDGKDETYAFWTRDGFPVWAKTSLASLGWAIVRHAGIRSSLTLVRQAIRNANAWNRIYDLQDEGRTFETPEQIVDALGLGEATSVSLGQALRKAGANEKLIKDIAEPIVHNMYNQGEGIEAFAGEVGLAGAGLAGGYLYCIDGGNWSLLHRTLEAIGVTTRYNTTVTSVERRSVGGPGGYEVRYLAGETSESSSGDGQAERFDLVVLAAPLALAHLKLIEDGRPVEVPVLPYQKVETTLVAGTLDPRYFGVEPDRKLPSTVFIADSAPTNAKSIGVTGCSPKCRTRIYKIFSADHRVTDEEIERIFSETKEVLRFTWEGAYPVLRPGAQHVPFTLRPGLYYANAFETVAGSIEVEAVGGVNAGRLAAQYAQTLK
ncbi:prenylcysteine lyase family protein [Bifidobacterium sp. SO4]|uniref:prenylcysteine lyase family protein n=1 Tax=Bifidobacterium sp. SO4 TaxID=2809030 RepID=UPI001BDC3843|nr:prenylcysteine lyase family protein [Bifidobacterium sp. SO4]MBT1170679.1 FAD-dependent oxidoreductase [Bifidobacterium sp. SO4]